MFTSEASEEANSFTQSQLRNQIFIQINNKYHAVMSLSIYAQVYKSVTQQHVFFSVLLCMNFKGKSPSTLTLILLTHNLTFPVSFFSPFIHLKDISCA